MPKGQYERHQADSQNNNWRGGKSKHELIHVYRDMIGRCTRESHQKYADYGGRGITVCQHWLNDFWAFVEDMGDRPEGKTPAGRAYWQLDRVNNDGDYEPSNTRWTTPLIQANNKRKMKTHGILRGSKQELSKLGESQVLEMLSRIDSGETQRSLASEYGVSVGLVNLIHKGKRWNWLTGRGNNEA